MNKTILALAAISAYLLAGCGNRSEEPQRNAVPARMETQRQNTPSATVKEVVNEERMDIPAWSATLVQRYHGPEASDDIALDVELEDRQGKRTVLATNILGPVVVFARQKIIASCEAVGIMSTGPSPIFISLDGKKRNGPAHLGVVASCRPIEDAGLLLVTYNDARVNEKPYSRVRVIDTEGLLVLEREFDAAGTLEVQHNGKSYRVQVPAPELPGSG